MKHGRKVRPRPPRGVTRSSVTGRTAHTTVPARSPQPSKPPRLAIRPASAPKPPRPAVSAKTSRRPSKRMVARIVDDEESTLLDLIDNLLAKGVMLNADLVLALADVDLVYVRVSALLCAADRILRT